MGRTAPSSKALCGHRLYHCSSPFRLIFVLVCDNHAPRGKTMKLRFLLLFLTLFPVFLAAQPATETGKPFVVEYYYKAKWGHADEFLQLFKKNHYPLLKKEV